MSNVWLNYVWEHSPYKGSVRLVHLALADSAHTETGECWPHQDKIAAKANISRPMVTAAITKMVADGYLTKRRGVHGTGNTYWLQRVPTAAAEEDYSAPEVDYAQGEYVRNPDMPRPESGHTNVRNPDIERPESGRTTRTPSEPPRDPSVQARTPVAAAPGDDADEEETSPRALRHADLVEEFRQKAEALDVDFNVGTLRAELKSLREEGFQPEQVSALIRLFFARSEIDIRNRTDLDVAAMFRQRAKRLKKDSLVKRPQSPEDRRRMREIRQANLRAIRGSVAAEHSIADRISKRGKGA